MEAFSSMDLADKKTTEDRVGADLPHVVSSSSIALQRPQAGFRNSSRVKRPSELPKSIGGQGDALDELGACRCCYELKE
jgi:hypothetical protein